MVLKHEMAHVDRKDVISPLRFWVGAGSQTPSNPVLDVFRTTQGKGSNQ